MLRSTSRDVLRRCFFQSNTYRYHSKHLIKYSSTAVKTIKKSDVSRLIGLAKPEIKSIAAAVGFLSISSGVTMSLPFIFGRLVDVVKNNETNVMLERLDSFAIGLFGLFIIGAGATFARVYFIESSGFRFFILEFLNDLFPNDTIFRLGQRIIRRLRNDLYSKIIQKDVRYFDKTRTGSLINRLASDTAVVGTSLTSNLSEGLRASVQVLGGSTMLFYISTKLALSAMIVLPPMALVLVYFGRKMKNVSIQIQDSLAKSSELAEETIGNIRTVRFFAQENKEISKYAKSVETVFDKSMKEAIYSARFFMTAGFCGNMLVLSVFYTGGILMQSSSLTIGDLTSFLLYAAWVGTSTRGLTRFYSNSMKALGASSRLWQISDHQATIESSESTLKLREPLQGAVAFKNVHFSYPSRTDIPILTDLSLEVPPGLITAVVGTSGCGKSTLASLLLRLYDPCRGSVLIDGIDLKSLSPKNLRQNIGIVNQEPTLFSTTIADNISYGIDSNVSLEEIKAAAAKANCLQFIESFPDGFDTIVGERGILLSGGQKQRVAIARAIIKDPRILILDEATSALDAESEYQVKKALERILRGRTVIQIAHRLSTIKNADQIAVLNKGRIGEVGSYDELMALENGMFARLVQRQAFSV